MTLSPANRAALAHVRATALRDRPRVVGAETLQQLKYRWRMVVAYGEPR